MFLPDFTTGNLQGNKSAVQSLSGPGGIDLEDPDGLSNLFVPVTGWICARIIGR